jgi:hypothetical protein
MMHPAPEMIQNTASIHLIRNLLALAVAALLAGCASTPSEPKSSDGITFRKTDKFEKVWIADGFDFSAYQTLLCNRVTASVTPKDEKERERLELLRQTLSKDLAASLEFKHLVPTFATKDTDITTNANVLKLDNDIVEFSAGSAAARIMVGMGAGTPRLRVKGQLADLATGKPLIIYELDETAPIFGAAYVSSRNLQTAAGSELAEDVAEFLWQVAKHQPIKYK